MLFELSPNMKYNFLNGLLVGSQVGNEAENQELQLAGGTPATDG